MFNEEEEIPDTHVGDFTREVVTDNEPKAKSIYSAKAVGTKARIIRTWALENDIPVNRKGRLSRKVIKAYLAQSQ